jgi:stage II sporulation protein D
MTRAQLTRSHGWLLACLLPIAFVLVACVPPTERPTVNARPRVEPNVRVQLRSLGEWKKLTIEGKGDLFVITEGAKVRKESVVVVRSGNNCRVEGVTGDLDRIVLRARHNVLTVNKKSYSGEFVFQEGMLLNVVPMENYVLGVLRGEIPLKDIPQAAAEAQAIAVRSYTLHYIDRKDPLFDVDDTTLFQVYAGLKYAPDDANLRKGVQATRGRVLMWEGKPVQAFYHSTCGGHTTDVPTGLNRDTIGCMPGVPCEYCSHSKYYRWKATLTEASVLKASQLKGRLQAVRVTEKGPGGRAKDVEVLTTEGKRRMRASTFRLQVGPSKIRSTKWMVTEGSPDGLVLTGAGWGHGVGLCQMGAIGRARKGKNGGTIVRTYYPGAKILTVY